MPVYDINYSGSKRKMAEKRLEDMRVPHSREAERAILGAILIDPGLLAEAAARVTPDHFFLSSSRAVYQAMIAVTELGQVADLPVLVDYFNRQSSEEMELAGGPAGIAELLDGAIRTTNLDSYIQVLEEAYIRRSIINHTKEIIFTAMDRTSHVSEIFSQCQSLLELLRSSGIGKSDLLESIRRQLDLIASVQDGSRSEIGLATGYREFDRLTGGLQPTDLIIIAARPGTGKSALAFNIADNVASMGKGVGIISLEMAADQVSMRIATSRSRVDYARVRNKNLNKNEWHALFQALEDLSNHHQMIQIDDRSRLTVAQIGQKAYQWKAEGQLDLLIVDHAQLAKLGRRVDSRAQEVGFIAQELKSLAKQLGIPLILLSQLNRSIENRKEDDKPRLSDLKESGGLEENADIVAFLHRKRGETETELIIEKHRNGSVGVIPLVFLQECMRFESMWKEA